MKNGDDLRARLQAQLGTGYAISRELGGGGMSRVFVAHDTVLDREIVIKVLPPELAAAISGERFHREILLAAQLQHPHIVPVLTAGAAEGLDYYVMPLIEGESLRTRLSRLGGLPIADVTRIAHDVIDALAYAHGRGIVHRDIKPENVLMSGQHALVTDFGVAKAVSAGTRSGVDTGAGVAIGTPAYMAPEQAAADPGTDHRADIYAFGILIYELLAGHPPFSGRPPHEILAAQIAEAPEPIGEVRPDTPPQLASLIMECLEKSPARRPQSAAEVRDDLEALITPTAISPLRRAARRTRRRLLQGGVALAALLLIAVAAFALWPRDEPLDDQLIAVVPFRVSGASPALGYLREGMIDLLAAKLNGSGGTRAADPRSLLSAWQRAARGEAGELSRDDARGVARHLGAGQLLLGDIVGTPRRLTLNASLVDVDDGTPRAQTSIEGPVDSLPALVDRLTAQLLSLGAGEEAQRLSALTSTSLPALRAYLDGQMDYRHARFPEAATSFRRAIEEDSTFALAALGLAKASVWYGHPGDIQRGFQLAWAGRERLGPRDRAYLDALVGPNYPGHTPMPQMIAAKERLVQIAPDRADAWFEMGDGYFHWGASIGLEDPHDRAAAAFRRAIAIDSTFSPAIEHLILIEARQGNVESVGRLSRLYLAIDSTSAAADAVRWRWAVARGDTGAARAIVARGEELTPSSAHTIEMISQLDGVDPTAAQAVSEAHLRSAAGPDERLPVLFMAHDIALNTGKRAAARRLSEDIGGAHPMPGQGLRERIRAALFWDGDSALAAAAVRTLERRIATPPSPDSERQKGTYYGSQCVLSLWWLAHGELPRAERGAAELRRYGSESGDLYFQGCALMIDALAAERSGDASAGELRARLDSLMRTAPGGPLEAMGNLAVARLHESKGELGDALAAVRRRAYFYGRPLFLSTYLREEGRLAAATGDVAGAIDAYRHYLALRSDPDPELRRETRNVQAELERLLRESAGR